MTDALQKNDLKNAATEIHKLHGEIGGYIKIGLEKGVRIGEILVGVKGKLPHGEFLPWIKNNALFKERSARNYMNLYKNRDVLKSASVADLNSAYKLLSHYKKETQLKPDEDDFLKNYQQDMSTWLEKIILSVHDNPIELTEDQKRTMAITRADNSDLNGIQRSILCYCECVNRGREAEGDWNTAFEKLSEEMELPLYILHIWHEHFFGEV